MRRVTEVTKEMPVSRQVSCSIFSSRLRASEGRSKHAVVSARAGGRAGGPGPRPAGRQHRRSLTWGRAQTAGFYSAQHKARTRQLLNRQRHVNVFPFPCASPQNALHRGRVKALASQRALRSAPQQPRKGPEGWHWLSQPAGAAITA